METDRRLAGARAALDDERALGTDVAGRGGNRNETCDGASCDAIIAACTDTNSCTTDTITGNVSTEVALVSLTGHFAGTAGHFRDPALAPCDLLHDKGIARPRLKVGSCGLAAIASVFQ